jgi:membrane protease YdiL (CAAX protease family)
VAAGGGGLRQMPPALVSRTRGTLYVRQVDGPQEADSLARGALVLETLLALVAIFLARLSREPLAERLGLRAGRIPGPVLAILVLGTLALSFAIDGVLELTGLGEQSSLAEFEEQLAGIRGPTLAFALLAFAGAAGIAEELLCRGWLQRGLQRRFGAAAAIGVSSLLFGALHVDPIHAVSAAFLGLYLGVVAWLAASIRPSILCHVANNTAAVGLAAWEPAMEPTPPATVAIAFALALAALGWSLRTLGTPDTGPNTTTGLQPEPGSDDLR